MAFFVLSRGSQVVCALLLAAACAKKPPPAPVGAAARPASDRDLVVLPNNTAVVARGDRLVAVRREGDVLWEAVLPASDVIVAPTAVALNSTAFVRSNKALHAVSSAGKWLWSKSLDGPAFANTPSVNAPTAFPDSTVAVAVADDIIRFDDKGVVRWRVSIPEGHVSAPLRAAMDGALFVPTTVGLYCLSPDGNVSWMRAIGN